MRYIFLRFKNNFRKFLVFFLLSFLFASFVFYANENFISSDKSKVAVVDLDKSELSAKFIEGLKVNDNMRVFTRDDLSTARTDLEIKKVDFIAVILEGFEENIARDLYEDSLDIYFREADIKTDIVKDTLSIEVVKLWVGEEFAGLDEDSRKAEIKNYINILVRDEEGILEDEDTGLDTVILFTFLILIAVISLMLSREYFVEEKIGMRNRLADFGIQASYYLDALLYRIISVLVLFTATYMAAIFIKPSFIDYKSFLIILAIGFLYAFVLELIAQILSRFIAKLSSFTLVMEILVLLSLVLLIFLL